MYGAWICGAAMTDGQLWSSETVVPEISDRLQTWNRQAFRLRVISVILAVVGVVASVLVASDLGDPSDPWKRTTAVVAAIAAALLASLDLAGKSDGTRRAWRHLNVARLRYCDEAETDEPAARKKLIQAYEEGEAMVGDLKVTIFHRSTEL